eukprot:6294310-Lingulodinium_polyedra.AAC.1
MLETGEEVHVPGLAKLAGGAWKYLVKENGGTQWLAGGSGLLQSTLCKDGDGVKHIVKKVEGEAVKTAVEIAKGEHDHAYLKLGIATEGATVKIYKLM